MLLTPIMAGAGILAALAQWVAHQAVKGHRWATPIVRYTIGVFLCLLAFSIAYSADSRANVVSSIWYVFGASGIATWLAYIGDPQPAPMPPVADLESLVNSIVAEHEQN